MADAKIEISFKNQAGEQMYVRVKVSTEIKRLLKSYCIQKHLEYGTVDFYLEGIRVPRIGTIGQAGLKDDDIIDVVAPVFGGGPSNPSC
ncbi:small ubiquitin-related modifier 2-like [Salvia hispanica]|uniref:small ubiquitin-related modifier 2-like n=1 Tax=Salvia hispanica TaxID=49212 RepID=UPI002008F3CF|nr:small ubiquitin-related modifier 2-like [Salvia hispanica]